MAQLPLLSVMSGVAAALLVRESLRAGPTIGRQAIFGFALVLAVLWGWMAVAAYAPNPAGRGRIIAYDEFLPVAEVLRARAQPGDTLYMLPEYDGSTQLHEQTDLPPPGFWMNGHAWFFAVPQAADRLTREWQEKPPTYIVYFPDLIEQSMPYIEPFVTFMREHYALIETIPDIPFNGDAEIWQLTGPPG